MGIGLSYLEYFTRCPSCHSTCIRRPFFPPFLSAEGSRIAARHQKTPPELNFFLLSYYYEEEEEEEEEEDEDEDNEDNNDDERGHCEP